MNTQGWRVGSLFAGIGGFDLAARNVGWGTAWFSEVHPYARKVLAKNFPGVPNHGDITQIDFTKVEPVEVLCGGFPCQDISYAGAGAGIDGARSGLWGEYQRAIGELRPRYVVVENVAALLGRGLERVLGDLAALGYDAEWHCIPASTVGAPHRRDRIWVVAYPDRVASDAVGRAERHPTTRPRVRGAEGRKERLPSARGEAMAHPKDAGAPRRLWIEADDPGYGGLRASSPRRSGIDDRNEALADPASLGPSGSGELVEPLDPAENRHWEAIESLGGSLSRQWAVEPNVGRVANGVPDRVDRLFGLGNAIVPQVAEAIFRAIQAHEEP